ncbi:sialic acid-binding Ig-like lectin 13 isoform X2 [Notamacropus eugenii]|uniref:sialic acid-binding Ig-like lectin 13 isoform X2 n=1 Tax=Notamacropus eugenii TaxID=9315 RepID=UPI003B675728
MARGGHGVQGVTQRLSRAFLSPVSSMRLLLLLPLLWEGSLSQTVAVQPSVTVQEGMCAHVPCTFNTNGLSFEDHKRIYGYWFRDGSNVLEDSPVATNDLHPSVEKGAQGRFHLVGKPRMKSCSLNITNARFSDRGKYFFRLDYESDRYSFTNQLLHVNVTDFTQKPDISMPEVLESGNPVTLKCTFPWACGQYRFFTFSWIGTALSSKTQNYRTSPSSQYSFISGPQHHGTNLTCHVTLPGGHLSTKRTVQLNVSFFVSGNSSALVVQEGSSLHLLCAATSNPPATLIWILGDQTLPSSQPSEDGVLHLDLLHLGPADGGNYTCLAQHPLGSKVASLSVSVQYESTLSHMILGVLCGAGTISLLALCLLLLVKMLRKKSVEAAAQASKGKAEDCKRPSWVDLSLNPISPAADTAPIPTAPQDGLDELHYACLNLQGTNAREDNRFTDPSTIYSEITFQ